ncbi:MAG: ABC transporter permease [Chloroflexi bacterium]|nr:ABC transporter permease [Chloroflexota bacterium]
MASTINGREWSIPTPRWVIQRGINEQLTAMPARRFALRGTPSLWVGGVIVAALLAAALAAPLLTPFAPDTVMAGAKLDAPSLVHPFGTDALGRDMLSRVAYGARIAVGIAVFGVAIAATLGIIPGLIAGYRGGWVDQVFSRAMDVWLAFPGMLLALIIVSRLGPSLENTVIALGLVGAPGFYRVARSTTISARRTLYVQAAEAVGAHESRILFRHILPNLSSSLIVLATMRSGMLLLASGGLSFVGLGAQPPLPEWGSLLAAGRNYMDTAPWLAIYPGACITLAVAGLNLLGDGLRDLCDPRQAKSNERRLTGHSARTDLK